jgi:hypothetical protein
VIILAKIITYDLRAPGRDYSKLKSAIMAYSNACKVTESCWLIKSTDSCATIRENLWKHMDSNDILFIASLSGEAAGKNILCGQAGLDKVFS